MSLSNVHHDIVTCNKCARLRSYCTDIARVKRAAFRSDTYWAKPVLASIAGRIYSPSTGGNVDGTYRVERYSFTSLWEDRTGTRLRQRGANARIEYLDLTDEPAPQAN